MPDMTTDASTQDRDDDPPVIKTKLHFKRTAPGSSSASKRRKHAKEFHQPNANGSEPKLNRKPDFDLTNDDEPPLPKISKVFWPDKYTFKDALFAALSDPDDARHWAQVFGSEIHIYPRPRPTMSDDDYANWVREQVYSHVLRVNHLKKQAETERERAQHAARERERREERERKYFEEQHKKEREWQRKLQERLNEEAARSAANNSFAREFKGRNLRSKAPQQRWGDYLAAFQPPPPDASLELLMLWQESDVPWPTPSGLDKDISEANIRAFIKAYTMKYSEQTAGDWKKSVKLNQYFWHPDKFQQIQARKLEKLPDEKKDEIMQRVTEVSQILNKLAKE